MVRPLGSYGIRTAVAGRGEPSLAEPGGSNSSRPLQKMSGGILGISPDNLPDWHTLTAGDVVAAVVILTVFGSSVFYLHAFLRAICPKRKAD